jgi:hypothetical protein
MLSLRLAHRGGGAFGCYAPNLGHRSELSRGPEADIAFDPLEVMVPPFVDSDCIKLFAYANATLFLPLLAFVIVVTAIPPSQRIAGTRQAETD